jgi:hypothetical protein
LAKRVYFRVKTLGTLNNRLSCAQTFWILQNPIAKFVSAAKLTLTSHQRLLLLVTARSERAARGSEWGIVWKGVGDS